MEGGVRGKRWDHGGGCAAETPARARAELIINKVDDRYEGGAMSLFLLCMLQVYFLFVQVAVSGLAFEERRTEGTYEYGLSDESEKVPTNLRYTNRSTYY